MNILGIGKIGSAIAEKFNSYPQYSVFKISPDVKTDKSNYFLEDLSDPEQYDNQIINPNFKIETELDVIMCGEDLMCASSLRILENYKDCTIRIFYIKPQQKFLSETQRMTDKVVYNVLQEYTRSKRFDSMFIFEYDILVKTIGKVPLTQVKDKLHTHICSNIHMINFLDNNEPVIFKLPVNVVDPTNIFDPLVNKLPVTVWFPINLFEPLVFKLPVIVTPLVTFNEFKAASEPLTMTFFQFGIVILQFELWLDTYTYAVYIPTSFLK